MIIVFYEDPSISNRYHEQGGMVEKIEKATRIPEIDDIYILNKNFWCRVKERNFSYEDGKEVCTVIVKHEPNM